LQALQDANNRAVPITELPAGSNLTCTRDIRDIRDGLKEITVEASWGGANGRAHTARLITRYARNGLNDYFYTSR